MEATENKWTLSTSSLKNSRKRSQLFNDDICFPFPHSLLILFHLFSPAARADDMKNSKLLPVLEAIGEASVCDEGASVHF